MANNKINVDPEKMKVMIYKWGKKEVLDEGFVPIPKRFLRVMRAVLDSEKSLSDLRVILAIVDLRRPGDNSEFYISQLASIAGIKVELFIDRLKSLHAQRLLRVEFKDKTRVSIDIASLAKRIMMESDPEEKDDSAPLF